MTQLEIQEKALAALVRNGEAEYSHTIKPSINKKGYLIRGSQQMYRVCKESQYGLRKTPREEPIAKRCCASCRFKEYVDMTEPDKVRVRQGVRVCTIHLREVSQGEICEHYKMIAAYERL